MKPISLLAAVLSCVAAFSARADAPDGRDAQVEALLGKLTLEQKIDLLGGVQSFYLRAVPAIGLPRLRMSDGPLGVRAPEATTAYAGGLALAASWDAALAHEVG